MAVTPAQVYGKAKAFVDALGKLPESQSAAAPSGHFGRDYNTLRKLAMEALPGADDRLFGKYVSVHAAAGREVCDASFVEIETYARQILGQLTAPPDRPAVGGSPSPPPEESAAGEEKAYDLTALRREHTQAYAPWGAEDDAHLRSRFLAGATMDDLVSEFGRQAGGIRSRLRKLGLDSPTGERPGGQDRP